MTPLNTHRLTRALPKAPALAALVLTVVLGLCLFAWPNDAHADEGVIEISTAEQLISMAEALNGTNHGTAEYPRDGSYILTDNIDLAGREWTPIGRASSYNDQNMPLRSFAGTFDGNGHTISNLTITSLGTGQGFNSYNGHTIGLFGATNGATIKNLNLSNASITGTRSTDGQDLSCGVLVGLAVDTTITNCNVMLSTITDESTAPVATSSAKSNVGFGGLVGDFHVRTAVTAITNCNVGATTITSKGACATTASAATGSQPYTGGLVGRWRDQLDKVGSTVCFQYCAFSGKVYGNGYIGPFAAGFNKQGSTGSANVQQISTDTIGRFPNCFFSGVIEAADITTYGRVNAVYNAINTTGAVFNSDYTYANATPVTDDTIEDILNTLNTDGNRNWRIAVDSSNAKLLSLEFRTAGIGSNVRAQGQATLTAALAGAYSSDDHDGFTFSWKVNDTEQGTNASVTVPLTMSDQTVVLTTRGSGTAEATTATTTVPAAYGLSLTVARTVDGTTGDVTSLVGSLTSEDPGFADTDFTYQWYGVNNGTETLLTGETDKTLQGSEFGGFTSFVLKATAVYAEDIELQATASSAGKVVYLSIAGNDNNAGWQPDVPVATMQTAYAKLSAADAGGTRDNNIIVVMDAYTNAEYGYTNTTFNKPATITSVDPITGTDYRNGSAPARLSLYNTASHPGGDQTAVAGKLLYADTTFRNITLYGTNGAATSDFGYIYCQGHDLTMDVGVKMEGYRSTAGRETSYGLLGNSVSAEFHIIGGFLNYDMQDDQTWSPNDPCEIVVKSGSYARILGGGRNAPSTGNDNTSKNPNSHNQFGSEETPFNVSVTIDIEAAQSQVGTSGFTCDAAQVCGGQTDGTIYANARVTVKNGTVPLVVGASIGFGRNIGDGYPNNDFVGKTAISLEGGTVVQVYGGCLGRSQGTNRMTVDSRFLSSSKIGNNTPPDGSAVPDISITMSGGTVAPAGTITGGGLTGLFACGAGGMTGRAHTADAPGNIVNAQVSISAGSITGNIYGGGYGRSTAVEYANDAATDAGNLWGTSTISITGGTVTGNVYGGGAGTTAYLGRDSGPANALAQIFGDVKVSIADAIINGNVYGGAQGVSFGTESTTVDCSNMAKITGNVTLSIASSRISGSVYGGSALGAITGDVKATLNDVEVGSSASPANVYGGGEGATPAPSTRTADQQKAIGQVGGNATLEMHGGQVYGNVYGGGAMGAVLGAAGTKVTAEGVSIAGSLYGGGQGALMDASESTFATLQKIVGVVDGATDVYLQGSTVYGNVYGGGSVGAVLGAAGTKVTVNGGDIGSESAAGTVYGGGQGALLPNNSNAEQQKLVGWVPGNVSVDLLGATNVFGNVYGGGSLGVVGDGGLSTDAVPYTITQEAIVNVTLQQATSDGATVNVHGSVFGGGAGDASAGGQLSRILGAVFGTTHVLVHEGSIGGDVFGGGDQGNTYSPLVGGQPSQATSVIVNGSGSIYVNNDGSVAEQAAGAQTIDEVTPASEATAFDRTINLNGSVFGGGNIADVGTIAASNVTVYGNTNVYLKGSLVTFVSQDKGGVYGDGNLSRASGTRFVTLINLKSPADAQGSTRKSFFSLQRADRAVVHNSNLNLRGARDLVLPSDTTLYSLNRVDDVRLYASSTLEFDTVVNGLGSLWSDVLPDRTFTTGTLTEYGDTVTANEKAAYRAYTEGSASSWTDKDGNEHSQANTIIVNNGKWLDVKQSSDAASPAYGTVTGLFSLVSSTASEGGAFVFGQFEPTDSTGTFVSLNRQATPDASYLDLYTQRVTDVDGVACRVWFIRGDSYTFTREVKAYTSGTDARIQVMLPMEKESGFSPEDYKLTLTDEGITVDDTLIDMKREATTQNAAYQVDMTFGEDTTSTTKADLPLVNKPNDPFSFDYSAYVTSDSPALVPATINLTFPNELTDNIDPQEGYIRFKMESGSKVYTFELKVIIEESYAVASEAVHYGHRYENIAVENAAPITTTSAYTSQFTTTYCPDAYRGGVTSYLTTRVHSDVHSGGVNASSAFPAGTGITLVDITSPTRPKYYYYACGQAMQEIPLSSFANLDGGAYYSNPTGNTVITENLLFIIDYANGAQTAGTTYLTLDHRYGTNNANDILRYERTDASGAVSQYYNNLWNGYQILGTDSNYVSATLSNPDTGSGSSVIEVGTTENFMFDTYTTRLNITTQTDTVSTAYDESEVAVAVSVGGLVNLSRAIPLGSQVIVTKPDGSRVATRYLHTTNYLRLNRNCVLANLGSRPASGSYTVEVRVSRYLANGTLFDPFALQASSTFNLNIDLYRSEDGLYQGTGAAIQTFAESFEAARNRSTAGPTYSLDVNENEALLTCTEGTVTGDLYVKESPGDDTMTVMRRTADTSYVNITTSSSVQKLTAQNGKTHYRITDTPGETGSYEYAIRFGNTVYTQRVTVS